MSVAADVLALIAELDRLYRMAVMEAAEHRDEDLLARGEESLEARGHLARMDRLVLRLVRRGVRTAIKLRSFWESRPSGPIDWRSRVDEALGGRAWLPGLQLAQWGLEVEPSPELFEEVQRRFAWAYLRPWLEGVTYEGYLAVRGEPENEVR
jgi:hypothetical protein